VPDTVWKKEARSRKEATHLLIGAGYKWVYTARRGNIFDFFLAKIVLLKYNTGRYAKMK